MSTVVIGCVSGQKLLNILIAILLSSHYVSLNKLAFLNMVETAENSEILKGLPSLMGRMFLNRAGRKLVCG